MTKGLEDECDRTITNKSSMPFSLSQPAINKFYQKHIRAPNFDATLEIVLHKTKTEALFNIQHSVGLFAFFI